VAAWPKLALGLALGLGLQGCGMPWPLQRQTLIVYVDPPDSATLSKESLQKTWDPLLQAYRRLHPGVHLSFNFIVFQDQQLKEELRRRNSRGLGPDLIVINASTAIDLLNEGLISRIQVPAGVQNSLQPWILSRVQVPGGLSALPIALEPQLSCYNRARIPSPPATLEQLLQLAASGRRIGLSVFPKSIWWTAGPLGANQALMQRLEAQPGRGERIDSSDQAAITTWLRWLREASLQSHVNFFNNDEDLLNGLGNGQLDWISCLSFNLPRLKHQMGEKLGVASLPAGPHGLASPDSLVRVLGFGVNSSPIQRRRAMELALLQLNPLMQHSLTVNGQQSLPVNRFAPAPVASSAELKVLINAQEQFQQSFMFSQSPVALNRLNNHSRELEALLTQVVVDVIGPEQASSRLIKILRKP
jgi:ABC-type glycerol-3-phosphate transport system substrate-binding protein